MKNYFKLICVALACGAFLFSYSRTDRQTYRIYVDSEGIMRRSDTGAEVSWFGTNYTLPFAHAFRAAKRMDKDPQEAIRGDVYHLSRLGLNAFRLHLWDVELTDSLGNLLDNEHLRLLDFLISELEDRGIDIILTAQTNFGNGYPEKDTDTGGYSYDFPKCGIHENPQAQEIQENYLRQLATHVNPFTGRSYAADNAVIAMEINNEPCHTGTPQEVTAYINRMASALRDAGFDKPILYNASHNPEVTSAYYDADIEGVTFQWYPTGLVAGHERKGNHLPALAEYPVPWEDSIPGVKGKAKVIYEFDPGDVTASYLYPPAVRTLRGSGFQWITQFAYDPLFLAPYNTEYQTHFLNLAYTPGKALGMMIAAETAREIPLGAKFPPFPADSVFGHTRVNARLDLADFDNGKTYIHTNNTGRRPVSPDSLTLIAGRGSSPLVSYSGTGAYFLDLISPGLWRLEVMPDVMLTEDPFRKPSPDKRIARIARRTNPIAIKLGSLGPAFHYKGIDDGNSLSGKASDGEIRVSPGVYLLSASGDFPEEIPSSLSEYHAPQGDDGFPVLLHSPKFAAEKGDSIIVEATVFGEKEPEDVTIYPENVSFWRKDNQLFQMTRTAPYVYSAKIPASDAECVRYRIVVRNDGEQLTFPGTSKGNPLDWDFTGTEYFSVRHPYPSDPVPLLIPQENDERISTRRVPDDYSSPLVFIPSDGKRADVWRLIPQEGAETLMRIYIGKETAESPHISSKKTLGLRLREADGEAVRVGIVTRDGLTRAITLPAEETMMIPLADMKPAPTNIVPLQFPAFMPVEIDAESEVNPDAEEIEFLEITLPRTAIACSPLLIEAAWLE